MSPKCPECPSVFVCPNKIGLSVCDDPTHTTKKKKCVGERQCRLCLEAFFPWVTDTTTTSSSKREVMDH